MEQLQDPLEDRVMKNVPPAHQHPLKRERLWKENENTIDLDILREHLLREGHIEKDELVELIQKASQIMKQEPNVININ